MGGTALGHSVGGRDVSQGGRLVARDVTKHSRRGTVSGGSALAPGRARAPQSRTPIGSEGWEAGPCASRFLPPSFRVAAGVGAARAGAGVPASFGVGVGVRPGAWAEEAGTDSLRGESAATPYAGPRPGWGPPCPAWASLAPRRVELRHLTTATLTTSLELELAEDALVCTAVPPANAVHLCRSARDSDPPR